MRDSRRLTRRTMLRGLGATMALPMMEAMLPRRALAAPEGDTPPQRLAFLFVPNGAHMAHWSPAQVGALQELPPTLEPLQAHRERLLVLAGLAIEQGKAHGDGPGDHARSGATFLTCAHPVKVGPIHVGPSVDQVAARAVGRLTRLPSLELGSEGGAQSGQCDSGYSCAYSSNISWSTATTPAPKETDPRRVFERLFADEHRGETAAERERRIFERRSLLDFVLEDAKRLTREVGSADRARLEQYLDSVREVERRIEAAESGEGPVPGVVAPTEAPKNHDERVRMLIDLMALAFQTDTTRIASFMVANAGSGRSYPQVGVREAHHGLSHHGGDEEKQAKIAKINRHHVGHLAYLLDRLAEVNEGDGVLADHVAVVYGSGLGDGNRHNHNDLPILLAGGLEGLAMGRHLVFEKDTPLANLYVGLLQRMGVDTPGFADSTGRLAGI